MAMKQVINMHKNLYKYFKKMSKISSENQRSGSIREMILNDNIFRAYDIRGEAFVDFDEDGFFVVAQAFGQYLAKKFPDTSPIRVWVSGDGRQSLPNLGPAVLAGLAAAGCDAVWGGSIPTPIAYFALHDGKFDAIVQISASHNPAADNGLKLVDRSGAVCGDEIQKIRKRTKKIEAPGQKFGRDSLIADTEDVLQRYKNLLKNIVPTQLPLRLVVDAGNGIAGTLYPGILRSFGHHVDEIFCDLDTTFPNHQPDPERPENLQDLITHVQETQAQWGIAFDGDGDRLGVVTADGAILNADKILFVLASDFLSRHPGAPIVIDAMSSATLAEKISAIGGTVIRSKTGHSFIEEAMHMHRSALGGEQSGHFMIGEDFFGHDDACLATLRFLGAIERFPALISEITTHWPALLEFSEKFAVPDAEKFQILEKISAELVTKFPHADTTDGVRVDWADGEWAIVRCSNTTPKIAIRIEAKNKKSLDEKRALLTELLQKFTR